MTSTFDNLGYLFYLAKKNPEFRELVLTIYDYAIGEIDKVNPKMLTWGKWVEKNGITMFAKLYGVGIAELRQKADFLGDAHYVLDHYRDESVPKTGGLRNYNKRNPYHLRCVNRYLNQIISKMVHWFYEHPDDGIFGVRELRKPMRDKYPKVFKTLKPLLLQRILDKDRWSRTIRKKVESW